MTTPATPSNPLSPEQEHHVAWNDRLQDWLDGELDPAMQAHLGTCALCQARLQDLQQLDESLRAAAPSLQLDASFDQQLFAKIDAMDESQRIAARQRIEREWHESLQALSRSWRRTLAFVIPGVIAGIVLAFVLAAWLVDDSGVMQALPAQSATFFSTDTLRIVLTALLGAGVGLAIARWLATFGE